MRILIVTPAPRGSLKGNRVTAQRWARLLRGLGHRASVLDRYQGEPADLLVALHAAKSSGAVSRFARLHPGRPIVVALTGTDIYGSRELSPRARSSLERATRLIALQPLARRRLEPRWRRKTRVILQSLAAPQRRVRPREGVFEVVVLGHLRGVKDPFLAARAARLLPPDSRIQILHAGAALNRAMARRARVEMQRNPRYRWLGELPRPRALALLARARLALSTSRHEGGANAVSEAIVCGTPVLATRIDGSVGLLGARYPGLFAPGDARALARLLSRAEREPSFLRRLAADCRRLAPDFDPAVEREAWRALLAEL